MKLGLPESILDMEFSLVPDGGQPNETGGTVILSFLSSPLLICNIRRLLAVLDV
jgi:hypothetical protein